MKFHKLLRILPPSTLRSIARSQSDRARQIAFALFLGSLLFLLISSSSALWADGGWSEPRNLSQGGEGPSRWPEIVADSKQRLHVIWAEKSYDERGIPDTIYYTTYNGLTWSRPADILVSPDQKTIDIGQLVITADDDLEVVWGGNRHLFLSKAPVDRAQSASSWQTIKVPVETDPVNPAMFRDQNDDLYIAYVKADDWSVHLVSSVDRGQTWSQPRTIWIPPLNDSAGSSPRVFVDSDRVIHVAWTENTKQLDWNPSGIWYSRSVDGGKTWIDTFSLRDQGSNANFGLDSGGTLHLVWNHNIGSRDGRYSRYSTNGGKSWSPPTAVFSGLSGRTRFPVMDLDNGGTLHLVFSAGGKGWESRIYWSYWTGSGWAEPIPVSGDLPANESPDMVVTAGNKLNVVWHFGSLKEKNVWYASMRTSALTVNSGSPGTLSIPRTSPISGLLAQPSLTRLPATPTTRPTANLHVTDSSLPSSSGIARDLDTGPQSWVPLAASIAPVVSLLVLIAVVRFSRSHNH